MTTEELILNFSTQAKDLMKEIADYEQKLANAKERYLKLQGAVEGLNILQDQNEPAGEAPERELLTETESA
nr:hypothetical protein [uncultured Mediterranean phage uvMED]BAR29486.1 hypothetical protein [uncultured Mediterranean phage uvMED]